MISGSASWMAFRVPLRHGVFADAVQDALHEVVELAAVFAFAADGQPPRPPALW